MNGKRAKQIRRLAKELMPDHPWEKMDRQNRNPKTFVLGECRKKAVRIMKKNYMKAKREKEFLIEHGTEETRS